MAERSVIGWDVGGAHVKACLVHRGAVVDAVQWPCPLWQGMDELAPVLHAARERWAAFGAAWHAVTMTGEMVDLFAHREDGVRSIAAALERSLCPHETAPGASSLRFFAGDAGWCRGDAVAAHWQAIASANWIATARHCALQIGAGVLVDIGSTTTDLIAFRSGHVLTDCRTDAQRLASGELVYQGVVRTPLCALTRRIDWCGTPHNVMNEFFATTADVYRLTGELRAEHDQHPSADHTSKDLPATRQRLARMIGLDQREATPNRWLAFAHSWREAQVAELGEQLRGVMAVHALGPETWFVSAGCGDFLVPDVVTEALRGGADPAHPRRIAAYGRDVVEVASQPHGGRGAVQAWAQVCAPCVAAATLFDREQR
jgi:probable H4MPT-linked C1 transfer pathway protein